MHECTKRLERARYLPIKPEKLVAVVSVGCLSLLDYVNTPSHLHYKQVAASQVLPKHASRHLQEPLRFSSTFSPSPHWTLLFVGYSQV